ncbi:uncharacterized protein BYT42DRAFT_489168 [Radiomyces spectabilis]|uniref:uncharacterized protein n=1 Tax=Radiomyces spectabilis TaxID=64574 RepID=UPI002220AAD0|nr:uncharacterized protein BYT42DRAFT_489168 [Radiomyces spectabilis]KAI8391042.1 hypothetical protein BYT42DRAFT_489168 [Radiomyces spectabilis]
MAEEHIYMSIKTHGAKVKIKLGERNKTVIDLVPHRFDKVNGIIEFRSRNQASLLFHLQYNPSLERVYELPPYVPMRTLSDRRYVGDKGMILSMSYLHPQDEYQHLERQVAAIGGLPVHLAATSSADHRTAASLSGSMPSSPRLEIHHLRVTLGWIVSGMNPKISPTDIYSDRYHHLANCLARHGFYKYDPVSEPVLAYILEDEDDLPASLVKYVQAHTHECHTRLTRLQHMLEGAGVDARVLWKYTFAKSFVIGNGSLLGEEDVVRRIQDSEDEWRRQRVTLTRKLAAAH